MMSGVGTVNTMPSKAAIHERDLPAWQTTLAAAQRVLAYYASRAEVNTAPRAEAESSSATPKQDAPALRLAA